MIIKSRHIVAAVALHLLLFGLLLGGAQCSRRPEPVNVIQGALLRPDQLPRAAAEPKAEPAPEPPTPPPPPPPPPPKPDPAEQLRQQQLEQQKQAAEARAQADAKAAAEAKEKLLAQQKEAAAKVAAEQAAADKAAAQKAAELKKQQAAEDAKRRAEAEEKQRADDLRKAAEAEDKKRADEDAKKKALQKQLDAEAKRRQASELQEALGAEAEQRTAQEVSEWGTQLQAALQRVWIRPPGLDQNLKCVINMRLSPTGEVLSASIRTSSGNALYDESVVRAAYKASPLPLPRNPTVFQSSINITFIPK